MCGGVQYSVQGKTINIYFPNPKAQLPVRMKDQSIELMPWGRRKNESGHLPPGGWARHESVLKGTWDKYQPVPVKIQVDSFMEKDLNKVSHWFDLEEDQFIQGLLAQWDDEYRVYVVTISPPMDDPVHNRWPRIIKGSVY